MSARAVFVSDVHLSGDEPRRTRKFLKFLEEQQSADAIFILGDLFDFWIGPKHARLPEHRSTLQKLRQLTSNGTYVVFLAGNRDFYIGDYFERELGVMTISSHQIFSVGGKKVFLTHGERFWARSAVDRHFNAFLRTKPVERLFTSLPAPLSLGIARGYRCYSKRKNRRGKLVLMQAELRSAFQRGVDAVICGHVHRTLRHTYLVEGRRKEFFVLGNWKDKGSYLELTEGEFHMHEV